MAYILEFFLNGSVSITIQAESLYGNLGFCFDRRVVLKLQ